jgi:hypothetical protein
MGLEASAVVKPVHWWRMVMNGSAFHYKFNSTFDGCSDASILSYAFSMINNFNIGKSSKLQFDANFVGPRILSQGREDAYFYFDLAFRQPLAKNRLQLGLVAHDIFRTAKYYSIRRSSTLDSDTYVSPKYPNIILSLTYSFNGSGHKEKGGSVSSGAVFEGKDF